MSNENKNEHKNNPQPGQQAQQDKSSKSFGTKSDQPKKDKDGKLATSNPGSGKFDSKRV
jgi:hypothetical protein